MDINEYVRTSNNINNPSFVAKIIKIENKKMIFGGLGLWITFDNKKEGFYENIITKHSEDIIDLIEVGDYVNGRLVVSIMYDAEDRILGIETLGCLLFENDEIRTILTKQQFESNAYKIEKER